MNFDNLMTRAREDNERIQASDRATFDKLIADLRNDPAMVETLSNSLGEQIDPLSEVGIERLAALANDLGNRWDYEVQDAVRKMRLRDEANRLYQDEISPQTGRVLDWSELEDMSSRPQLVPGLLSVGTTALLVSKRNIGKSMVAFALAGAVATGNDFVGRPVKQGKALLILGEGVAGAASRFRAWCAGNNVDMAEVRQNVSIMTGVNLSSERSMIQVREQITATNPDLIVFDTWSTLSGVANEVDQAEAARVLSPLLSLGGDAVKLILHHPNAESEDTTAPKSRGGSTLPSNVDTVMTLWYDNSHRDPSMQGVQFMSLSTEAEHAGKQKDMERETIRGLHLAEAADSKYLAMATGTLSFDEQWCKRFMTPGKVYSVSDLIAATSEPESTVKRHLRKATRFVTTTTQPGRATLYTFGD